MAYPAKLPSPNTFNRDLINQVKPMKYFWWHWIPAKYENGDTMSNTDYSPRGDYCEAPFADRVRKMSAKKCHFYPKLAQVPLCPPSHPHKWKFGSFKWSFTLEFQVPIYPSPETNSLQIWNYQVKLDFKFQSATLSLPPLPPKKWCKTSDFWFA